MGCGTTSRCTALEKMANNIHDCESSGSLVGSTGRVHAFGSAYPSSSICFVGFVGFVDFVEDNVTNFGRLVLLFLSFHVENERMKGVQLNTWDC